MGWCRKCKRELGRRSVGSESIGEESGGGSSWLQCREWMEGRQGGRWLEHWSSWGMVACPPPPAPCTLLFPWGHVSVIDAEAGVSVGHHSCLVYLDAWAWSPRTAVSWQQRVVGFPCWLLQKGPVVQLPLEGSGTGTSPHGPSFRLLTVCALVSSCAQLGNRTIYL